MIGSIKTFFYISAFLLPCEVYSASGWSFVDEDKAVVSVGDGCTGTRISNDGHILTARHCFNECLIQSDSVETEKLFPEYGWRSPNLYKLKSTAQCSVDIDGYEALVDVIAIGPGFMTPMEQSSLVHFDKELYEEFLNKSYFHNGDFAIIKAPIPENSVCRELDFNYQSDAGESVSFRGYPMVSTGRPEGRNSDGESMLEGSGVTIESIFENTCISSDVHNADDLSLRYDRDELILSTVDNLPGGSGSALLGEEGKIIGLINSQYRQGVDIHSTYCAGSTVAVSARHILKILEEMGFEDKVSEFFNCSLQSSKNFTM